MRMSKVEPYMTSNGPALVQNRKSQAHYLFGKADGESVEGEAHEMKQLKRRYTREAGSPPPLIEKEDEITYVIHVVEPHHTLRGISLLYRVTVDEIKRLNMMWTDDELYTRKNLKIPVDPNGMIYHAVMNNRLDELMEDCEESSPTHTHTHTHTTMNLLHPRDVQPREQGERYQIEQTTSKQFLEKLDQELTTVLRNQERIAQERIAQEQSSAVTPEVMTHHHVAAHSIARRQQSWLTTWMPQDWRAVALLLAFVAVVLPLLVYFFEPMIVAPPPHAP